MNTNGKKSTPEIYISGQRINIIENETFFKLYIWFYKKLISHFSINNSILRRAILETRFYVEAVIKRVI